MNTTQANSTAKKFFYEHNSPYVSGKTYSQRLTKPRTNWLFSYGSSKNMNDYIVTAGSFTADSGKIVHWEATKIKYGSSIINYTYEKEAVVVPTKSDTLILLEAVRDAFNEADDNLDYSVLTADDKAMITAQRKAINLEIRMNR